MKTSNRLVVFFTLSSFMLTQAFAETAFENKCEIVKSQTNKYSDFYTKTLASSRWISTIDAAYEFDSEEGDCYNCCTQTGTIERIIVFNGNSDVPNALLSGRWVRTNIGIVAQWTDKGEKRANRGKAVTCLAPKPGSHNSDMNLSLVMSEHGGGFCDIHFLLNTYSDDSNDSYQVKIINKNRFTVEFGRDSVVFTRIN